MEPHAILAGNLILITVFGAVVGLVAYAVGHANVSPWGLPTFILLGALLVAALVTH